MYWAKVAKPHMVDIGKILGHLTHTYIAFQSLDDKVLENIKRKNIRTEELSSLIDFQGSFSSRYLLISLKSDRVVSIALCICIF